MEAPSNALDQGSPTSRPQTDTSCQISSSMRLEMKYTVNVVLLNHPQTITAPTTPQPPSMEKLFSTKPVSGAKKVGDLYIRPFCLCQQSL